MSGETTRNRCVVVFLGPTLPRTVAQTLLDAIYLPAASQGSIIAAVHQFDPDAILIIDGTFQNEPAVRHKEILWAISQGIPVIGAASMGALRAAELYPHMYGVGLIYRWYRRFQFAPDDAVAVLHGPPEADDSALTIAEVDLRMTFRALERSRIISKATRKNLCETARKLNFRNRSLETIVREAGFASLGVTASKWTETLAAALIQQKQLDARKALSLLKNGAFGTVPGPVPFSPTAAFVEEVRNLRLSRNRLNF